MNLPRQAKQFTNEDKQRIAAVSGQGLHQHLNNYSVVMFDEDPRSHELSSGTLITICDRIFIATAAHNIPPNPSTRLQILPDEPRQLSRGVLRPGISGKNSFYDVGFLEVSPLAISDYFSKTTSCELDRVLNLGSGDPTQLTVLLGSPAQFASVSPANTGGPPFTAKTIAVTSTVLSQSEWPLSTLGRAVDPATDVFMDYPALGMTRIDTGEPLTLGTPKGFSGGGMWSAEMYPNVLWSPEGSRLYAIEIEWDPALRLVRATQIIHWLNLIRSEIPELRTYLEHKFPSLLELPLMQ